MNNIKKHKGLISLGIGIMVLLVTYLIICLLLFNFAFKKGGFSTSIKLPAVNTSWFNENKPKVLIQDTNDNVHLKAYYFPAKVKTNKTVIICHGYGGRAQQMTPYIKDFHDFGYNVLAPDARALGASGSEYVGYGWLDREDLARWVSIINEKYDNKDEIGLFGLSMGASEVLFTLGEPLHNVKFAIADCGYSSIPGELTYQLKSMFHLPSIPILPTADIYSIFLSGYNFYDGNTHNTLYNNKIPLLIIQGSKDKFVPTSNAYTNFSNDRKGEKQLWIVKGAGHAESRIVAGKAYVDRIKQFSQVHFAS